MDAQLQAIVEKLKPCPFCGSTQIVWREPTHSIYPYMVGCQGCGCQTSPFNKKEIALEQWNTRAESPIEKAMKWISVEEKLPQKDTRILTYAKRAVSIDTEYYIGSFCNSTTTHWMPLPEPPAALTGGGE